MKKLIMSLAMVALLCGAATASERGTCASEVAEATNSTQAATNSTIVTVAQDAGSFNTLLQAATAAGLVDTLNSEGPFTVFAPTDEAFAKLPDGTLEALLQDKEQLKAILLYHVVPGEEMAADVVTVSKLKSAQGSDIPVKVKDGKVKVGQAEVVRTDIKAGNGVIHVIDTVILPE